MSDESIFNPPADQQVVPPKPEITLPDSVAELVGEGKKYASVEKALEALPHAQQHILRLEQEAIELREKAAKAASAEEVLRAVQELKDKPPTQGVPLDDAALAELVSNTLNKQLSVREAQAKAQTNAKVVTDALVLKHGDKAEEVYRQKASELGITVQRLNELASESPKAALMYFNVTSTSTSHSSSTVNSSALDLTRRPDLPPKPPKSLMAGADSKDVQAYFASLHPDNRK